MAGSAMKILMLIVVAIAERPRCRVD